MRSVFDYKSKEEFEKEKAEFESYLHYRKSVDPDNYEDWFDKEVYDLYTKSKMNPYYFAQRVKPSHEKVSMVRVPTRCPMCKQAWAIETQDNGKVGPSYLDQSVYKNIPMVKGLCQECRD